MKILDHLISIAVVVVMTTAMLIFMVWLSIWDEDESQMTKDPRTGWIPSANLLAQISHFFIASTIVFVFPYLLNISPWWTGLILLLWIAVKEFVFDLVVEGDTVQNGFIDGSFYIMGWSVSIALCFGFGKL